jgi:hypothetical protein
MKRRSFLTAGGFAATAALAGCTVRDPNPDVAENPNPSWSRPGEVYHPAHRKGMKLIGTQEAGDRTVALSYTYVERFWTVTGTEIQRVGVDDEYNAVHLMVSVWDTGTETIIPVGSGLRFTIRRDGETITERAPWPMLSPLMGFHFGDNIYFPGHGTYSIAVDVGTTTIDRRGAFEGQFEDSGTATFEFDFLRTRRNEIRVEKFLDRKGERSTIPPMEMARLPLSIAPPKAALPGRVLGEVTSGDAVFVVTATDTDAGTYLAACPRTPYNRYVLPLMTLSARLERDGTVLFDDPLQAAIDPDRSYHYGATVEGVAPGDELTVTVDSPPQVSRHEGYETAFLEMPATTLSV